MTSVTFVSLFGGVSFWAFVTFCHSLERSEAENANSHTPEIDDISDKSPRAPPFCHFCHRFEGCLNLNPPDPAEPAWQDWSAWKASALNRLFQEQGATGRPGRITAATVRHGEASKAAGEATAGIRPISEWGPECARGFVSNERFARAGMDRVIARTAHARPKEPKAPPAKRWARASKAGNGDET